MPKRRFTLRALLIANALFALAAGGWVLWERSQFYAKKAEESVMEVENWRLNLGAVSYDELHGRPLPQSVEGDRQRAYYQSGLDRAQRLHDEYRRVARFPWLTLR